ncbi:type 4b pilus protein PilO2 [Burkholderia cepacia]|jgi:hypothetical protein|uniref:Type 4b pilus protein PilO2 n=1 Tax=Burkholderia contaminans TaxID=488447 RepID=A0ABD7YGW7_9BURK|nr:MULTISPECIES: type 4b pilus protein PilO2 [Burkholderia]EKS9798997.1 type 4b pilus protein PilO2 [Burkholderia cepacia]EKS9805951.1 type 4b pilus protein PilO2 [Burkholderia cepacia]EKS9813499.1 type 4b pilus protein PilO2 [Burkholderia cepacia]EKS9820338.1 type 4b pilus protein PilO2 [Burkholderia cepacia]EKS9828203.1 type 4b pilus protein PilO2 [Burkholderia cepacia]
MVAIVSLPDTSGRFALGLTWEHEPVRPKSTALRERARRLGRYGLVRQTSTGVFQAGYGALPPGTRWPSRIHALASRVAEHHASPWLGVYRLTDDVSWLIAVRDGEIVPGGDVVGSHVDVDAARDALRAQDGWRDYDGTAADLAEMVGLTIPERGLTDLQATVPLAVWLGAAVVACGAMGIAGVVIWQQREDAAERLITITKQRAQAAARRAQREAELANPPWTRLPAPSTVFAECAAAWRGQDLSRGGWTLTAWRCAPTGDALTTTSDWTREGGTALGAPGALTTPDHSTEIKTQPANLPVSMSEAALDEAGRRAVWALVQTDSLSLELPEPARPAPASAAQEALPWRTRSAVFTLPAAPWTLYAAGFDAVPGLRVDGISYDLGKAQWTVQGALYTRTSTPRQADSNKQPTSLPVPAGARA